MKTIGVRALRENPSVLSQSAEAGEYVVVTNRHSPISIAIPFSDELLEMGLHVNMAIKFYEEGLLSLGKSAQLAKMSVESFLEHLSNLGIAVVDQTSEELLEDLDEIKHV